MSADCGSLAKKITLCVRFVQNAQVKSKSTLSRARQAVFFIRKIVAHAIISDRLGKFKLLINESRHIFGKKHRIIL